MPASLSASPLRLRATSFGSSVACFLGQPPAAELHEVVRVPYQQLSIARGAAFPTTQWAATTAEQSTKW